MWSQENVDLWIKHVHLQHNTTTTTTTTTATTTTTSSSDDDDDDRCRSRPVLLATPPPEECQLGLEELSQSDRKRRLSVVASASGRKKPRMETGNVEQTIEADTEIDLDSGATPRAPAHQRHSEHQHPLYEPLPFYHSKNTSSAQAPLQASSDVASSDTSSHGSKRAYSYDGVSPSKVARRRTSPSKRKQERMFAPIPVERYSLERITQLPANIQDLAQSILTVGGEEDILPDNYLLAGGDKLSFGVPKKDARIFAQGEARDKRDAAGIAPSFEEVEVIHQGAVYLNRTACSEAEWNCTVHFPLLRMAVNGTRQQKRVRPRNITTAKILPEYLANLTAADKDDSRKVDLCIALELDDPTPVVQGLQRRKLQSVNHTDYGGTQYTPIAVSIETKTPEGNAIDGLDQLQTWIQAQFNSLRYMLNILERSSTDIPAFPILLVHGQTWYCHYIHDQRNKVHLWESSQAFGSTATVRGIYQVIAGLQHILYWVEDVYRSWLDREILQPLCTP